VKTYNAALHRTAYQSSTHHICNIYLCVAFQAHFGNDGYHHTSYSTSPYCAVTRNESNPWWAVDLGEPTAVYGVKLTTSYNTGREAKITGL